MSETPAARVVTATTDRREIEPSLARFPDFQCLPFGN
jgi:hypothetical protein